MTIMLTDLHCLPIFIAYRSSLLTDLHCLPIFIAYRSSLLTDRQSLPASTRLSSANKLSSTDSERLSPRATLLTKLRCTPSRRATRVYIPHTDSTKAFSFFNLAVGDSSFAVVLSWLIMSFTYFCLVRCFRCGGRFARGPFMRSSSRFCHVWCQPCCL
jgi:hypothetical protein